jgi:hypothetical protein
VQSEKQISLLAVSVVTTYARPPTSHPSYAGLFTADSNVYRSRKLR